MQKVYKICKHVYNENKLTKTDMNNADNRIFKETQLQARLSSEMIDFINDNYQLLYDSIEPLEPKQNYVTQPIKKVVDLILKRPSKPADLEKITQLEATVNKLQAVNSDLNKQLNEFSEQNESLMCQLSELQPITERLQNLFTENKTFTETVNNLQTLITQQENEIKGFKANELQLKTEHEKVIKSYESLQSVYNSQVIVNLSESEKFIIEKQFENKDFRKSLLRLLQSKFPHFDKIVNSNDELLVGAFLKIVFLLNAAGYQMKTLFSEKDIIRLTSEN